MRGSGKFMSTALVAAGLTVALVSGGLAQDATPTSMTGGMEDSDTLAAHIHAGACGEAVGEPVALLAELQLPDWVGAIESGESDSAVDFAAFGIAPVPVAVSTSEVPLGIADIVSGGHSITAEREDPADPEDDVACGSIGGVVDENGDLFVGLAEMNDSGHSGVAWLHDTGASTTVVVFVAHPDQQEAIASALADMEASGAAATPVETTTDGAMATPEAGSATPTA